LNAIDCYLMRNTSLIDGNENKVCLSEAGGNASNFVIESVFDRLFLVGNNFHRIFSTAIRTPEY